MFVGPVFFRKPFREHFWYENGAKIGSKTSQKLVPKKPKNIRPKRSQKGSKNGAKMESKTKPKTSPKKGAKKDAKKEAKTSVRADGCGYGAECARPVSTSKLAYLA